MKASIMLLRLIAITTAVLGSDLSFSHVGRLSNNLEKQQQEHNYPSETMSQTQHQRSLIIHGHTAVKHRYPYFVALDHVCGGTLIAPDLVLTAGHCMPHRNRNVRPRVGLYRFFDEMYRYDDVVDEDDDDVFHHHGRHNFEEFDIVDMIRHPDWLKLDEDEYTNDYAILKLSGKSSKPWIQINRNSDLPSLNQTVIAMGVGNTNPYFESRATTLQEVSLNVISNEKCELARDLQRDITFMFRIWPSMMCTTGGPFNEQDACDYDSGSPIVIPSSDGNPKDDLLVGLVSWGENCADPVFPGVNARVSFASDWIVEQICSLSKYPPDIYCKNFRMRMRPVVHSKFVLIMFLSCIIILGKRLTRRFQQGKSIPTQELDSDENVHLFLEDQKTSNSNASEDGSQKTYDSINDSE